MKNLNDEAPVFEPEDQIVIVKEGAKMGLQLLYIQAYDPDGDNITFTLNDQGNHLCVLNISRI